MQTVSTCIPGGRESDTLCFDFDKAGIFRKIATIKREEKKKVKIHLYLLLPSKASFFSPSNKDIRFKSRFEEGENADKRSAPGERINGV